MWLTNRHRLRPLQLLLRFFVMVVPVLHQRLPLVAHYHRRLRRNSKTIFEYLVQGNCKSLHHLLIVTYFIEL